MFVWSVSVESAGTRMTIQGVAKTLTGLVLRATADAPLFGAFKERIAVVDSVPKATRTPPRVPIRARAPERLLLSARARETATWTWVWNVRS